jgi:CMP-N,N'-diacetyllegionaminic acid synthase
MARLCTICARGGSRGLPSKNIRLLHGKPMIAWTVLQARATRLFDHIAVSSDSEAILAAAAAAGANQVIRRPDALASDTAAKVPAIHHAVLAAERETARSFETLVDLDATAPLRLPADIAGSITLLEESGASSVITGALSHCSPYFDMVERRADGTVKLCKPPDESYVRRQDVPQAFDMNASVYVWNRAAFMLDPQVFYADTRLFEMPPERSRDVDSEMDFAIVEFLFGKLDIADAIKGLA